VILDSIRELKNGYTRKNGKAPEFVVMSPSTRAKLGLQLMESAIVYGMTEVYSDFRLGTILGMDILEDRYCSENTIFTFDPRYRKGKQDEYPTPSEPIVKDPYAILPRMDS